MAPKKGATKSKKLEDQAATAALYVTRGKGGKNNHQSSSDGNKGTYPLNAEGKLSAASAATSLKHATAQDLPAFPVVGVEDSEASAGTAAHLANAHPKTVEYWKPGKIPAANKAAGMAKDLSNVDPIYTPEESAAGSRAALLASRGATEVHIWRPKDTSAGHTAATEAFRGKAASPPKKTSAVEASKRMQSSGAGSQQSNATPTPLRGEMYPDAANSAANALRAATSAHRSPPKSEPVASRTPDIQIDAARIHSQAITNLSREMYTSTPPIGPELEKQRQESGMRAAAITMAKRMYEVQQRRAQEQGPDRSGVSAAASASQRPTSSTSEGVSPPRFVNLQEAAQKLAAERLAKLHDEQAAYRDYYGTNTTPNRRRTILNRNKRTSTEEAPQSVGSGEVDSDSDDEERSRQIRTQMSLFTDKLAQVDRAKRTEDRHSLMAAAQRNVRQSMNAQDQRVFEATGKVTPAMMADWEERARAKAQEDSKTRMASHEASHGMVHIGGGKFLDQSEIDAIAASKVQPTLDEVEEAAERRRARDEELRLEAMERQAAKMERVADERERKQNTKDEWKQFKDEEKREARQRKDEAKAKKNEAKKAREGDKRKSRFSSMKGLGIFGGSAAVGAGAGAAVATTSEATTAAATTGTGAVGALDSAPQGAEEAVAAPAEEGEHAVADTTAAAAEGGEVPEPTEGAVVEPVPEDEATDVAQRVFDAPVEGEGKAPLSEEDKDAEVAAATTANVDDAPVVDAGKEIVAPAEHAEPVDEPEVVEPKAEEAAEQEEEKDTAPAAVVEPTAAADSATAEPATTTTSKEPAPVGPKPEKPLAKRIAPAAAVATASVPATFETTVSGGKQAGTTPAAKTPTKDKEPKRSWLRKKLSRSGKSTKSVNNKDLKSSISKPQDSKSLASGANLGSSGDAANSTPVVQATPSNDARGTTDSSMHEVAVAGKPSTSTAAANNEAKKTTAAVDTATGAATEPVAASSSHAGGERDGDSTSISSLSSDEDTRGRSAIRMADAIEQHRLAQQKQKDATATATAAAADADKGKTSIPVDIPTDPIFGSTAAKDKDVLAAAAGNQADGRPSVDTEKYEEAKDTLEGAKAEGDEELKPPASVNPEGRQGESPGRDSKFVEAL